MPDFFTPQLPAQDVAKSIGQSLIPEYLKNPNVHGLAPNENWKTPRSQPDNPLPWLGMDLAGAMGGGLSKAALTLGPATRLGEQLVKHQLLNESKDPIGRLVLNLANKKHPVVDTIGSYEQGALANKLSLKDVRSVVEQLKKEYPEAHTVGGYRSSGARALAGKEGWTSVKLRPDAEPSEVPLFWKLFGNR